MCTINCVCVCVYLCEEDAVKEQRSLLLVLGDVCIAVHAKHLWVRVDGEGVDGLQVALVLQRDREKKEGKGREGKGREGKGMEGKGREGKGRRCSTYM